MWMGHFPPFIKGKECKAIFDFQLGLGLSIQIKNWEVFIPIPIMIS